MHLLEINCRILNKNWVTKCLIFVKDLQGNQLLLLARNFKKNDTKHAIFSTVLYNMIKILSGIQVQDISLKWTAQSRFNHVNK